ncbi:MAG: D-glycero-alpha-D-manno-heptose-7-phosphate kinase [Acidobacteriota bacterium]|nr:D-glycero-alpha-D-manno-heptose-7-phosphate kinase [Acidobacteriota bacterium]
MTIEATAPTRVDLAGGTIDIWPLYLFHPGATTVNFAISMHARCRIEPRADDRIILESRDRGVMFETRLSEVEALAREERLELISKLVHFFRPETGFHLITESMAPAGAGLGGSSALAIACIGALNRLVGERYPASKFIVIAANVETTVIRVPAGFQDYYGAFYGGANSIQFNADGIRREPITVAPEELERRVVICYTGEPRLSGINNWEMFKSHIEGDPEVFRIFENIRDAARAMRVALGAGDWGRVADVMRAAYPDRKRLAPNITTPHMERLVETALAGGALAAKVCGAGGGGCIAFFCEEGARESVERALSTEEGAEVLKWNFARDGLVVREF